MRESVRASGGEGAAEGRRGVSLSSGLSSSFRNEASSDADVASLAIVSTLFSVEVDGASFAMVKYGPLSSVEVEGASFAVVGLFLPIVLSMIGIITDDQPRMSFSITADKIASVTLDGKLS